MANNPCSDGHAGARWPLSDARGIFCAYVCDRCEDWRRSQYRPDIFEDSNYWADEPIDEE